MVRFGFAKKGEIISPLMTAVLAARVKTFLKTEELFPGHAHPLGFNRRELQVIEQSLRLATKMMEAQKP